MATSLSTWIFSGYILDTSQNLLYNMLLKTLLNFILQNPYLDKARNWKYQWELLEKHAVKLVLINEWCSKILLGFWMLRKLIKTNCCLNKNGSCSRGSQKLHKSYHVAAHMNFIKVFWIKKTYLGQSIMEWWNKNWVFWSQWHEDDLA